MKYIIKEEEMCGETFYFIYQRILFMDWFFERWNTLETANIRLTELKGKK